MSKKGISIIIPIYNGARFVKATIESICNQTYEDFELILVDDGSTDNTLEICQYYSNIDSRIKVVHQENAGMSYARETGVLAADDYSSIMFADGDDIFDIYMLEHLMQYKEHDLVCACFANASEKQILGYEFSGKDEAIYVSGKQLMDSQQIKKGLRGSIGAIWGILINRQFYLRMNSIIEQGKDKYPQNFLNDVYCIPRFFVNTDDVVVLNDIYILHRVTRYSDSHSLVPNALHYELPDILNTNIDLYTENGMGEAYKTQIVGYYISLLKLWYQVYTREKDDDKRRITLEKCENDYCLRYEELLRIVPHNNAEKIVLYSIRLFGVNKMLWKWIIGNWIYGVKYRLA